MLLSRRWNKFWTGLTLGIVLPVFVFLLVYFIAYSKTAFREFMEFAFLMRALPKILCLCVIPNLIIFYLFLNREYWYATRGVISATFLYALAVVVIKFLPGISG